MEDDADTGLDYYGRKGGKFKLRGQRCKELGGLRKVATDVNAFLPDPLEGFIFLERDGPVMDFFYAKHTKEASKLKRKKFYRIVHFVEPLLVHWKWLLSSDDAAQQNQDELKKAERLLRDIESYDVDIVAMDISQDGEYPFYRKGNMEWDQGYVRMRVRDNNSLPHWLRRRWMSYPGKPIMDDEESEELAAHDDRAGVHEKNLPMLWRKFPKLPQLLTDALYNKMIEIENAGGPQAHASRLYTTMAAADGRTDGHDDMHTEVAPEIAFINFLERAASASPHPSRSNTPAPAYGVNPGYASPPPQPSSLMLQSPQLNSPLSPGLFNGATVHVMPPPNHPHHAHHGHLNGTPILSPRPMHAGAAAGRLAAAVSMEPPSKRRKLVGSDGTDKMQVDEFPHDLTGASGLMTPSQFFAPDTKSEPGDQAAALHQSQLLQNGLSSSTTIMSPGQVPLPTALVGPDGTVASPVSPLTFANIMQQYFQHVSTHITQKETENAALTRRVKKLKSKLKKTRRSESIAKTTVRFLRLHPPQQLLAAGNTSAAPAPSSAAEQQSSH